MFFANKGYKLDRAFVKYVFHIAIPMMLAQLITSSVNLIDNIMVGQLGGLAIGGVAASNRYFYLGLAVIVGVSNGTAIFIAQFFGAKRQSKVQESFRLSIIATLILIVPVVLAAILFPDTIIRFFNKDPGLLTSGRAYLPIAGIALIPQGISFCTQSAMRAVGDTKTPLKIAVVTVLTNVVFNYLLIFGHFGFPRMGVAGAAAGTLIARIVELTLTGWVVYRGSYCFSTRIRDMFKIPRDIVREVSNKSLPLTINELLYGSAMAMIFKLYATRGTDVMAAMTILGTNSDLFFIIYSGLAAATFVVVSQPLGANKLEEARANGYRMIRFSSYLSVIFASLMFVSSFIVPESYQVAPEIKSMAATFVRIYSVFYLVYTTNVQCFYTLRSGGDTKSSMIMDSGFFWLINIPMVAIAAYLTDWSIFVVFLIGQFVDVIKMGLALYLVRREGWVKNLTTGCAITDAEADAQADAQADAEAGAEAEVQAGAQADAQAGVKADSEASV